MENTLDFGNGSWEQAKGTIKTTLNAHDKTLYGNGKPGLVDEVSEIKTEIAVIKGYGQASAFWGRVSAAIMALGLTVIGLIVANHH